MGYTTTFEGAFRFDKPLPAELALELLDLDGADGREVGANAPGSYNQWILTKDRTGLKWDGNEKFYLYQDWLRWLISRLARDGIGLTGCVTYRGESLDDFGRLCVEGGKVVDYKEKEIPDSEALAFRDFVLSYVSPDAASIVKTWLRYKRERS